MPYNGKKAQYQHKENRGSMFENHDKKTEKHPDFRGSVNVNGTIYWMSAWKELTDDGKKYLSVSVQLQEERQQDEQAQRSPKQQQRSRW